MRKPKPGSVSSKIIFSRTPSGRVRPLMFALVNFIADPGKLLGSRTMVSNDLV
jgi:hypothetical protein